MEGLAILIAIAIGVSVISKIGEVIEEQKRKSAFGKAPRERSMGGDDDIDMDELIRQLNSQSGGKSGSGSGQQPRPEYTQPGGMSRQAAQKQAERQQRPAPMPVTVEKVEVDPWEAAAQKADSSVRHLPHPEHDRAARQWEERGENAYTSDIDKQAAAEQAVLWDKLYQAQQSAIQAQSLYEANSKKTSKLAKKKDTGDHRRVVKMNKDFHSTEQKINRSGPGGIGTPRIIGSSLTRKDLRTALITKEIFEPRWKQR